jgi:hypothetical protein
LCDVTGASQLERGNHEDDPDGNNDDLFKNICGAKSDMGSFYGNGKVHTGAKRDKQIF